MKITVKQLGKKEPLTFANLYHGELFVYADNVNVYMKLDDRSTRNAVIMSTGTTYSISLNEKIKRVKQVGEMIVEVEE